MKFLVNRAVAGVAALKKELEYHRIDQMAEEVKKIKVLDFDMESMKLKSEYMASKEQIEIIQNALSNYVPLRHFNELAGDFKDITGRLAKHEEIQVFIEEQKFIKNDLNKFI